MLRLVVFAMRIDDVRDIFGADPALAERLRAVAVARFAEPQPARRHWFKPMLRRDPDTEVRTDRPLRTDVDALLSGGYVEPDRLPAAWQILTAWLEDLSTAQTEVAWDSDRFDRVEWDLARAGLNSDYSLRRLADRQLGSPLRALPGQVVGYAKAVHVAETAAAVRDALQNPELPPETAAFVTPILEVLTVAADRGLDVVVVGAE